MRLNGVNPLACAALFLLINFTFLPASALSWKELASPDVGEPWVQPAQGKPAKPIWGHAKGLRVGLPPMAGPRGLIRIYAPYLGHPEERMINFLAVEPIPKGTTKRGFSEMELSDLDNERSEGRKRYLAAIPSQEIA